jgi:vacuolar-type H+-ATPase subunit I/STV1
VNPAHRFGATPHAVIPVPFGRGKASDQIEEMRQEIALLKEENRELRQELEASATDLEDRVGP